MSTMKMMLFFLLFFSCSNSHDEIKKEKTIRNDRKISKYENFDSFWNDFTQSVKSNDTLKLLELTLPVIEVGTIDDSDRTFSFRDKELARIILYEYQNGGYYDNEKNKDVSNSEMMNLLLSELPDYKKDSDDQRINNFVFSKGKDGWKLTGLYTQVDNYFKNHPGKIK